VHAKVKKTSANIVNSQRISGKKEDVIYGINYAVIKDVFFFKSRNSKFACVNFEAI